MAKYTLSKEQFINPYNFVPVNFGSKSRSDATKQSGELLTGYLDCELVCKTHMAIPDVANGIPEPVGKGSHYSYPFMGMAQGTPRIPGSSLRGVIRSAHETITDSCFSTTKKDTVVTTRSKKPFMAGILVREEGERWKLYEAKQSKVAIEGNRNQKNLAKNGIRIYSEKTIKGDSGKKVHFYIKEMGVKRKVEYVKFYSEKSLKDGKEGILYVGERAPKRSCHNIFTKGKLVQSIDEKDIQKLEEILKVYRDSSINKNSKENYKFYSAYERMKKAGRIPIYYDIQQKNLYLSFAALGRKAFARTLDAMYGEKAHQKCSDRKNLCPSCALFGTEEGEKMGSRIRFTDAMCVGFDVKQRMEKDVVFAELAAPRISYVPFYLQKKDASVTFRGEYDSVDLTLRGRKFYWHNTPELRPTQPIKKTERNHTFDVVNPETKFKFKVYFDGITERQLSLLEAAIHLNENDIDGVYCHKIGRGKPLGYGSVKMVVKQCIVRNFDIAQGWKESPKDILCDESTYECSEKTWSAFRTISNLNALATELEVSVEYPSISTERLSEAEKEKMKDSNAIAAHKWFSQNYSVGKKEPEQLLPTIDNSQKLKKYDILSSK